MTNFGGIVPLKVHTEFGFCVGKPGWNLHGSGVVGSIPEFRFEATAGLYTVFVCAWACDISTEICGAWSPKPWCAQIGPGGRPSTGPVSPVCPLTRAGSRGCCVWLAWAVGVGVRSPPSGLLPRAITSNRGIGVLKGCTPNVGLGGAPVGMPLPALLARMTAALFPPPPLAYALVTNGFRP